MPMIAIEKYITQRKLFKLKGIKERTLEIKPEICPAREGREMLSFHSLIDG